LRALAIGKLRGVCEADGARDNGKWGVPLNSEATGVYVPNARTGKEEYRARGVATVNKERDCDKASVVFFLATEKRSRLEERLQGVFQGEMWRVGNGGFWYFFGGFLGKIDR
jgi:hypothetical protein